MDVCRTLSEVYDCIQRHELNNNVRFSAYKTPKNFGNIDIINVRQVLWADSGHVKHGKRDLSGTPFACLGQRVLDCQFGPDRKASMKRKKKVKESDHMYGKGNKFLVQPSKKFGCTAKCVVREMVEFPEYKKTSAPRQQERQRLSAEILTRIREGEPLEITKHFIVVLPLKGDHQGHPMHECPPQPIDRRISTHVRKLAEDGVRSISDMKTHIASHLSDICETLPHPTNRRFYPDDKSIENLIQRTEKLPIKHDQSKLQDMETTDFLFIYQTANHVRLLQRYGEMVFMDGTYKTTIYDLPLMFIAVRTNVDYQIVGCFIVEHETSASLAEALSLIKGNVPNWLPRFFLTDFDESEISAIERVFDDITVLLCDFHREQAWERWSKKYQNAVIDRNGVLSLLRALANATTPAAYDQALEALKTSTHWENSKLQDYIQSRWLPVKERWCRLYRKDVSILASTNNGIECSHRVLKERYLKRKTSNSVCRLAKVLVESYLPERYMKYVDLNRKFSGDYRLYSPEVPSFLHGRPRLFIQQCMKAIEKSGLVKRENIVGLSSSEFLVPGDGKSFTVNLGGGELMPSCECKEWAYWHIVCKHMFAVLSRNGKVEWESLSQRYRESSFNTVDVECRANNDEENPMEPKHEAVLPEVCTESANNDEDNPMEPKHEAVLPEVCTESGVTNEENDRVSEVCVHTANLGRECREKLKLLTDFTYTIKEDALHTMARVLDKLVDTVKPALPAQSLTSLLPLKRRRAKDRFAGRSGAKAAKWTPQKAPKEDGHTCSANATINKKRKRSEVTPENGNYEIKKTRLSKMMTSDEISENVEELWKEGPTDDAVVNIGPYPLTRNSFRCLKSELCDEVIDAFLWIVCKKNPGWKHVSCVVATELFQGKPEGRNFFSEDHFGNLEGLVSCVNENRNHWVCVIVDFKRKVLNYLNPLGERLEAKNKIRNAWLSFLVERKRTSAENISPEGWVVMCPKHSKQMDSVSCGVYAVMFAENILEKKSLLLKWTPGDIKRVRKDIGCRLLEAGSKPVAYTHAADDDDDVQFVDREPVAMELRRNRKRKRRSSFVYDTLRKKLLFCVCKTKDDGRKYWMCDECLRWYHPTCLGLDEKDEPEVFVCRNCKT